VGRKIAAIYKFKEGSSRRPPVMSIYIEHRVFAPDVPPFSRARLNLREEREPIELYQEVMRMDIWEQAD
jgi:hypothetical protein